MGFLSSAEAAILRGMAQAMHPPLPPDITRWCTDNIEFDARSPFPGKFDISLFPFLRKVHEVLSPEHPSREVTLRGSAQWGKTVSVLIPTLAAWHEYGPLDSLVVHPTSSAATEWVRTKWMPIRRQAPSLVEIFGEGRGDQTDTLHNQETLRRDGTLKVVSAGSPDDLAGTTRRLVLMDDVAKFEMTSKGDPEKLAESRASGFEEAKIVRISTPQILGTCRVTRAFKRSDQQHYHLPCPHCGHRAPLTWENFRKNLDPERLWAACFSCDSCGAVINHADKRAMVAAGDWVAHNPHGDHPGFHLWRAYVPQRDWASIAVEYAQVMGWTGVQARVETDEEARDKVEVETEQTFWNDVLGLPYEQASKGPDWEKLRDRVENAEPETVLPLGRVPASGVLLTAGVDFQGDRIEVSIVAFGRNLRRWVVEHRVIPHYIGDEEGRSALNALLKLTWRTTLGLELPLDMMAVDEGSFTADVLDWAKSHPFTRVITVKGASSANGPVLQPQSTRKENGRVAKRQKRRWVVNVSQLKADFYGWLAKEDPEGRGYVAFATGLGDEYFRQITSEVRVLKRASSGAMTSKWELVEPSRRNECLDTMNYAEAAARKKGWAAMTDQQWGQLELERGIAPPEGQPDLFDLPASTVTAVTADPHVPLSEQAMPRPPVETTTRSEDDKPTNSKDAFARLIRR
ncbi:phage terminase large subunit family protein [Rhodobacter sp. NTK016B]|uniref:phage terminase large subunit family protein n=2 Tax=Rhodobacter sp. NTK016B TaxID=2759676 RepID=UPI001A8EFC44|nr:terminase gpA endonuclease subunit [Rhodobacter sp. NTK016B]MBN8294919.1 phage terminase large subunit family protein [Rhodobacter sp. NTK016B]